MKTKTKKPKRYSFVVNITQNGGQEMSANLEGRFCVRCKWHRVSYTDKDGIDRGHICVRFAQHTADYVTGGEMDVGVLDCYDARIFGGACGMTGQHFEPKDSVSTD